MPDSETLAGLQAPALVRRMACWVYEGVLLFGVVWIAGYLFGTLSQTRNALDNRHALQAFLFVVFGIYFVWFWAKGQTLAMKTWHIRLISAKGGAVSQARALLRYLSGSCRHWLPWPPCTCRWRAWARSPWAGSWPGRWQAA